MNNLNSIGDEEFIPFLNSLGVDTYKSFEWMLSDPEFGDVLRWMYNNLDHNNALSAREECRYAEIEKKNIILSPEDLDATVHSIQQQYSHICLPGDQEAMAEAKLDITMQKERLTVLERHDKALKDLIKQNELIKQELDMELIKLNAAQSQCDEDMAVAAQECLQLDEEVESISNAVIDVVSNTLSTYSSCSTDKETAKRFLTFSPLYTSYRQSQGLFRSHFDLYTTRKFDNRSDDVTQEDLRTALSEAKSIETRLMESLYAYIESKVEVSGEQAKLALVSNFNNVHPSQITSCVLEAQSSLQLLEQEERVLLQQVRAAGEALVASRAAHTLATATRSALQLREQISKDLSFLVDMSQQALAADRLAYCALRHELRSLEESLHFAAQLRLYAQEERTAVAGRVQSMKDIILEQECAERALGSNDRLVGALGPLLGVGSGGAVVQAHSELTTRLAELKDSLQEGFNEKERALEEYKASVEPLVEYVFDGCTRMPSCQGRGLAARAHALGVALGDVDNVVLEASGLFQAVKKGDKRNLRKLWQWFLTEPSKLFAAVQGAAGGHTA